MKFKTVSEFIHALEVEGKRIHREEEHSYIVWNSNSGQVVWIDKASGKAGYRTDSLIRLCNAYKLEGWREYLPEPETEEIELEEWLTEYEDGDFDFIWTRKGRIPKDYELGEMLSDVIFKAKTGVTRKVKVPK